MPPKVVRPRTDSAMLPLTLGGTIASLVAGWFLGAWVFKPAHTGISPDGEGSAPVAIEPATPDASVAPTVAAPPPDAGPPAIVVPVTVGGGLLNACGDGEEMDLPGPRCDPPPGLESLLRTQLQSVLGTCPAALGAARDPSKALSLGLRVDFARHRVVSLLGRSSSVPDKVSYVPCVNNARAAFEAVWRIQSPHPRYQYFFTAHFGPMRGPIPAPVPPVAPFARGTPVAPVAPVAPATPATPATPDADLPTAAQLLRMPAMSQTVVAWRAAIVREAPRTGAIIDRVPQNTHIEIVDRRGSWYAIRWERTHVGWTYRDAIGQ